MVQASLLTALAVGTLGCFDFDFDSEFSIDFTSDTPTEPPGRCPYADRDQPGVTTHPCCVADTVASDPTRIGLRISAWRITQPDTLASPILNTWFNRARREHRAEWLLMLRGQSTADLTVRTGPGARADDGSYHFLSGTLGPSHVLSLAAVTGDGARLEDTIWTAALRRPVVPIVLDDAADVRFALPLRAWQVPRMQLSEDDACVGDYLTRSFDTSRGSFRAYVTVEDARQIDTRIDLTIFGSTSDLEANLCALIADRLSETGACDDDIAAWPVPPDARCAGEDCSADCVSGVALDQPRACNAWRIEGGFAAQAVNIDERTALPAAFRPPAAWSAAE